jgi:hypothetical protein
VLDKKVAAITATETSPSSSSQSPTVKSRVRAAARLAITALGSKRNTSPSTAAMSFSSVCAVNSPD